MNKRFVSRVTRWLQGSRYVRVGVSGNFRPNVYIVMGDSGGERYTIHSTDDARAIGIALIEAAAESDRRVAEGKVEAKQVA